MDVMGLYADLHALIAGATAPVAVRYGDALQLAAREVGEPRTWRVPTRHGMVPCEVYRPPGADEPVPVLVHAHGGAFIMRHARMDDFWCRFVAAEVGVAVVNVDYSAAPRRRYPVAHEQVHDVVAHVESDGHRVGLDGRRLGVSGFSAGGNLVASACLRARDEGTFAARAQLLAVPSLDVSTADKPSLSPRPMISARTIQLARAAYFRDARRRSEPYASPLLAGEVSGLPPTMLLTAELDALRAEGDAYARRLAAADVSVEHVVVPRRDHYFLDGADPHGAATLLRRMAGFVAAQLG